VCGGHGAASRDHIVSSPPPPSNNTAFEY
jgi:hypothetical protein